MNCKTKSIQNKQKWCQWKLMQFRSLYVSISFDASMTFLSICFNLWKLASSEVQLLSYTHCIWNGFSTSLFPNIQKIFIFFIMNLIFYYLSLMIIYHCNSNCFLNSKYLKKKEYFFNSKALTSYNSLLVFSECDFLLRFSLKK